MTKIFTYCYRKGLAEMMTKTQTLMIRGPNTTISTRAIILLLIITVLASASGLRTTDTLGPEHRIDPNTAISISMTVTYELPQGIDPGTLRAFRSPEALAYPRGDYNQVPYVRPADSNSPPRSENRGPSPDPTEQNRRGVIPSCAPPDECRNLEDCSPGSIFPSCSAGKVCCVPRMAVATVPRSSLNATGRKPTAKNPNPTKPPIKEASVNEGFDEGRPAAFHGYLLLSEYPRMPPPAPDYVGRTTNTGASSAKTKVKSNQTVKASVFDSARRGGPPLRAGTPGTTSLAKLKQRKAELLPDKDICGQVYVGNRITNGKDAAIGQYPWMILLGFKSPPDTAVNFICGGSIINDRYVLTAAHCFSPQNILTEVRLGEYDLSKDPDAPTEDPVKTELVEEIIIHPNFSRSHLKHDIALVRLQNRIQYTRNIKPICLPLNVTFTQTNYTIAGWGKTDISNSNGSNIIQTASVQVLNHTECVKRASPYSQVLTTDQICAGGKKGQDVCSGDSGGPLTKVETGNDPADTPHTYVVGIVSFGADAPCGTAAYLPSVYTRVESYVPWILENMRS